MIGILGNLEGQVSTGYPNTVFCRTWSIDKKLRCRVVMNNGVVPNTYGLAVELDGDKVVGIHNFDGEEVVNIDNKNSRLLNRFKETLLEILDGYPGTPKRFLSNKDKSIKAYNALCTCDYPSLMGGEISYRDDECPIHGLIPKV